MCVYSLIIVLSFVLILTMDQDLPFKTTVLQDGSSILEDLRTGQLIRKSSSGEMIDMDALISQQKTDIFKSTLLQQDADPDIYSSDELRQLEAQKSEVFNSIAGYKAYRANSYGSKKNYLAPFEWKQLSLKPGTTVRHSGLLNTTVNSQTVWTPTVISANGPALDPSFIHTYGHSSFQLNNKLYKFMGCSSELSCLSDYLIFSYPGNQWSMEVTWGNKPVAREGQSVTIVGLTVYMFGGHYNGRYLNDLYTLDLRTNQWKMHYANGDIPSPRANHRAVLYNNGVIYIFGGYTEEDKYSNEMYTLDYLRMRFQRVNYNTNIHAHNDNVLLMRHRMERRHDMLLEQQMSMQRQQMDTNGANQEQQNRYEEIRNEQTRQEKSQKRQQEQSSWQFMTHIQGRELFSFFHYQDKLYVLFGFTLGGVTNDLLVYDIGLNYFSIPSQSGNLPAGRQSAAVLVFADTLYVIGGCNYRQDICYADCYLLQLDSLYWSQLQSSLLTYPARQDALLLLYNQNLLLANGCTFYNQCYSDLHIMNTNSVLNSTLCGPNSLPSLNQTSCICKPSYVNTDCSISLVCLDNCNNNGICNSGGLCSCYGGYYGSTCGHKADCPRNCTSSKAGICTQPGTCNCYDDYSGNDCSQYNPKKRLIGLCQQEEGFCGKKGICMPQGNCQCNKGYFGQQCQNTNFQIKKIVSFLYPVERLTLMPYNMTEYEEDPYEEPAAPPPPPQKFIPPPPVKEEPPPPPPPPPKQEPQKEEPKKEETKEVKEEKEKKKKKEKEMPILPIKPYEPQEIVKKKSRESNTLKYEQKPLDKIELTNFTLLEQNKEHRLIPEFFGLASDEDLSILISKQHTLREQSKKDRIFDELGQCEDKCHLNGICHEKQCYCRNGFNGITCENYGGQIYESGYSIMQLIYYLFSAYVFGLLVGLSIMIIGKKNLQEYGDIN